MDDLSGIVTFVDEVSFGIDGPVFRDVDDGGEVFVGRVRGTGGFHGGFFRLFQRKHVETGVKMLS